MAGTLAVDAPPKQSGATNQALRNWAPLPQLLTKYAPPCLDRQQGREQNNFLFYFFDILVTVPRGTLNMHLKFEMPYKYKISTKYADCICIYFYLLDIFKG